VAAYFVVDIRVTDPAAYEEYKRLAEETIAAFGGRYLVRGAPVEVLEGGWAPRRLVILEFASVEKARAWLESPEYQRARSVRLKSADADMILVRGI
jgi:uncharacterized protein (DUF1330 family)